MQKLLSEVEQGIWGGVLVMEVERLARGDTIDQGIMAQTFKYSNTKIITPIKTYDPNNESDEEYFEFSLFMSRREYKTINRRLQAGRIASVKEGKYMGSRPPFGYRIVKLENEKGNTLEIFEEEAETVRLVFSLYTQGEPCENGTSKRLGIQSIARRLNSMGIRPMRCNYWQKESIHEMIKNPVYVGKVRWGYRRERKKIVNGNTVVSRARLGYKDDCIIADGRHKPIIDAEVFNTAQRYLAQSKPPVPDKRELLNPLAGIIICGKCGKSMVYRRGVGKRLPYIVCPATTCKNVSAPFHLMEKRVLRACLISPTRCLSARFFRHSASGFHLRASSTRRETLLDWRKNRTEIQHAGDIKQALSGLQQWLEGHTLAINENRVKADENVISFASTIKKYESEIKKLNAQLNKVHDAFEQEVYTSSQFLERSRSINEKIRNAEAELIKMESARKNEKSRAHMLKDIIPKAVFLISEYNKLGSPREQNDLLKQVLEKAVYTKEKGGMYKGVSANDFELILYPLIIKEN